MCHWLITGGAANGERGLLLWYLEGTRSKKSPVSGCYVMVGEATAKDSEVTRPGRARCQGCIIPAALPETILPTGSCPRVQASVPVCSTDCCPENPFISSSPCVSNHSHSSQQKTPHLQHPPKSSVPSNAATLRKYQQIVYLIKDWGPERKELLQFNNKITNHFKNEQRTCTDIPPRRNTNSP